MHMRGFRTTDWKLVLDFANPGREELYDLKNDPHETSNLVESDEPLHVRMRAELKRKILERMRTLNDPALTTVH